MTRDEMRRFALRWWPWLVSAIALLLVLTFWLSNYHRFNLWASKVDPKTLDLWKTIATVFVAMIAAAITGVIQFRQMKIARSTWKTAQNKLKLDMFDRRLAIWVAAKDYFGESLTAPPLNIHKINLEAAIDSAPWLLDDEITECLRSLKEHSTDFSSKMKLYDASEEVDKRRLAPGMQELMASAKGDFVRARSLFGKYLRLTHEAD